jgi:hypothetical protein
MTVRVLILPKGARMRVPFGWCAVEASEILMHRELGKEPSLWRF